jgi:hypothetical protein
MKIKSFTPFLALILFGCNPKTEFCDCMNAERNLRDKPECEWIEESMTEAEISSELARCTVEKTDNPSSKNEKENLDIYYQNQESSIRQIERSVEKEKEHKNENSNSQEQSHENEAFFE